MATLKQFNILKRTTLFVHIICHCQTDVQKSKHFMCRFITEKTKTYNISLYLTLYVLTFIIGTNYYRSSKFGDYIEPCKISGEITLCQDVGLCSGCTRCETQPASGRWRSSTVWSLFVRLDLVLI